MIIYLIKSGFCLAIFYSFYKFLLEKESFHTFKRFYLLAALILAFGIPFITFTEYVEITPQISNSTLPQLSNVITSTIEPQITNYFPIILWAIYGLGVFLFSIKFIKNLFKITNKIKRNPKLKIKHFTNVLLQESIIPHTFFSYIFLNKHKFETHQIPAEVLLHEETHASQKHSLDVLFIEVLQIIFWFNPLIYFIKHSIKLNHEFLADQEVLNKGTAPSTYQQILLAFSSNASEPQLANAINYSSIKKRFTVMKTKTSKQTFWLRSFILLPLLAFLIYSFSDKVTVEKERKESTTFEKKRLDTEPILEISYNPDVFKLNGKDTSLSMLKNDFINLVNNQKSDLRIKIKGAINMSLIKNIMTELKGNLIKINLDEEAYIFEDQYVSDDTIKATPEEVTEYNKLAKQYNAQPESSRVVKLKDLKRLEYIYNKMTKEQKASAEPFPNCPPPPPPTKAPQYQNGKKLTLNEVIKKTPKDVESGYEMLDNGESHYYTIYKGRKTYYNKDGYITDDKGKVLPPPAPAPAPAPAPKVKKGEVSDIPPPPLPPTPKTPLDHIIHMAKKGAAFSFEGKPISSDEAIDLLKKNDKLNISSYSKNGKNIVNIQSKPIEH
jgi:bla regulator protein BlaR1